ncbi:hypothetical protein QBC39DRAFT_139055 [Podospora conica]|nr:hypothetical protein QBC39DRAFT_139055 [Schizothecium conicum]
MAPRLGSTALVAISLAATLAAAHQPKPLDLALVARAANYEDEVCHPLSQDANDVVPPCLDIVYIETTCTPNGTSPLALKAHQQCMCTGSFFFEWPFCLQCLFLHGLRSERDVFHYRAVLDAASTALCDVPTPTAEFRSIFSSAQNTVAEPTEGSTVSSDIAHGVTNVSLYFTATGPQGPGRITGDATAATATALYTAPEATIVISALPTTGGDARNAAATSGVTATGKAAPTEGPVDTSEASVVGGGLRAAWVMVLGSVVGLML